MLNLRVMPMDSTFDTNDAAPTFLVTDHMLRTALLISRLPDDSYVVHFGNLCGSYRVAVDYLTWDAETEMYELQAETFNMPIRTLKLHASRKRTNRQALWLDGEHCNLLRRDLAEFRVDYFAPDGRSAKIDPYASFMPNYQLHDLTIALGELRRTYRERGQNGSLPVWTERMDGLMGVINDIRLYETGTVHGSSVVPNTLVTTVEELAGRLQRLDQEELDASTEYDQLLYARVGDLLRFRGINVPVLPAWGMETDAVTGIAS